MPQVRIDLLKGKTAKYRAAIGEVIYDALIEMGAPTDDRFQIIVEHERDGFVYDKNYLQIERSDDLVMIQITLVDGRSTEQKRKLFRSIADGMHAKLNHRREDVFIDLVEVRRENWSFGNGDAQYA